MSFRRVLSAVATTIAALLGASALAQTKLTEAPPAFTPTDKKLKWSACPAGLPKGCQLAVLQGDPEKPGADIYLRLPPKSKIPAHKHTSSERIVVMQGDITVTYEGLKPMKVRSGTYTYGPAEAVHEAACVSTQPCVLFISFEKPVDLILATMASATATKTDAPATGMAGGEKKVKKGGC